MKHDKNATKVAQNEVKKMTYEEIKADIKRLSEEKFRLVAYAKEQGRESNSQEDILIAEFDGAINGLKKELEEPQQAQTLADGPLGGQPQGGGITRNPSNGKTYREMFGGHSVNLQNGGFSDFNEYLTVLSSGKFDQRLIQNTASETVPSDGGFSVIPEQFAAWLLDSSLESEIVRPRATVWPMKSESLKVPGWDSSTHTSSLFGGLIGTWLAELGASTEVFAKMRQIELNAKKLACFTAASNELVADGVDYEAQIQDALVKTLAWYLDFAFISGTGAGQPLGVINDPALIEVSKETGQASSTIIFENAVKMYARLAPQCMEKAIWIANQTTVPQLLTMSLAVGTGGAPIQPAVLQSNGKFSLLGKELVFTEKCPALGSKGQLMLLDLSQYCIGLRKEISLDKSIHPGWTTDEASYRAILRADGQGKWNAAITPKEGDTLSWCVALAA